VQGSVHINVITHVDIPEEVVDVQKEVVVGEFIAGRRHFARALSQNLKCPSPVQVNEWKGFGVLQSCRSVYAGRWNGKDEGAARF
jgi:hypothetical protein